jgi:hypothetical protein
MSPETKKKLLYGGGALASIAALLLFLKNKSGAAAPSPVGLGGGASGAGGPSSGTSANNAAALNAAVALGIEQSREQSALQLAGLQANTAYGIASLQAQSAKDQAQQKTLQAAFGPGGAGTAAAPAAAKAVGDAGKGLIDLIAGFFKTDPNKPNYDPSKPYTAPGSILDADNPNAYKPSGNILDADNPNPTYPVAGDFTSIGGDFGSSSPYVSPNIYEDYYQGSIGGGDASWFGSSPNDPNANGTAYNPSIDPSVSEGVM